MRTIPAHGKHGVRTQTLLTNTCCTCEGKRSVGASFLSLLNAAGGGDCGGTNKETAALPSKYNYHQL